MKRLITSKQDKSVQENDVTAGSNVQLSANDQVNTGKRLSQKVLRVKKQKQALLQKKLDQAQAEQDALDKKKKRARDEGNPSDNLAIAEHDGVIVANADEATIEGKFLKVDTTTTDSGEITTDPTAGGVVVEESSAVKEWWAGLAEAGINPVYLAAAAVGVAGIGLASGGGGGGGGGAGGGGGENGAGSGSGGSTTGPNLNNGTGVTNGGINASEANSGAVTIPVTLPAGAVAGNVVTLTIPGSGGGTTQTVSYTLTAPDIANGKANVPVSSAVLGAAGDGQKTITATVSNGANQVGGVIAVGTVTVDLTPPSAPSAQNVTAAKNLWDSSELANGINAAEAQKGTTIPVPLSSNVAIGDTMTLTLPASGSGAVQSVSHVVTSAEVGSGVGLVAVSSNQLTGSGNGSKVITAVISDAAGNTSSPITVGTLVIDTTVPAAPSPQAQANAGQLFNQSSGVITSANVGTSVPFPVALPGNVSVGDVVTLTIPGTNGGTTQTVTHTVTAAEVAAQVAQINVPTATLQTSGDGGKNLTAIISDSVGNVSQTPISVGSTNVNLTAPSLENQVGPLNGGLNAADLSPGGSVPFQVTLPPNTTAGDVIHLTVPGSGSAGSQTVHYTVSAGDVAAGSASVPVPSSTITATGDGAKVITATVTDTETNTTSSPITIGAVTVDAIAPNAPSVNNLANAQANVASSPLSGGLNAQESINGVSVPVALPGNVQIGDVVTLTIPGTGGGQTQAVSYTVTAADVIAGVAKVPVSSATLISVGDGSKNITAVTSDSTGNASTPISVGTFTIDATPPNAPSIANTTAAANQFNAGELAGGLNAAEAANGTQIPVALPANVEIGDVVNLTLTSNNGSAPLKVPYTVIAADVVAGVVSVPVTAAQLALVGNGQVTLTAVVTDSVGNQSVTPIAVGAVAIDTALPSAPSPANIAAANNAFQSGELAGGVNAVEASNGTSIPVALPANVVVGDVVTLSIPGTSGGVAQNINYTVTGADVAAGVASLPVTAIQLANSGQGEKVVTAVVSDAVGNSSASPIAVGQFLYDTVVPSAPSGNAVAKASNLFNASLGSGLTSANVGSSTAVPVPLPANVQTGDIVTLSIPSASSPTPILVTHTVTMAEITAGVGQVNVPLSTWQAAGDGSKSLTSSYSDLVGNIGPTGIAVGTVSVNLAAPNLETNTGVLSGGLNASDLTNNPNISIPVTLPANTTVGDVIHLTVPGSGGNPSQTVNYTVTANDIAAGTASVPVPSSAITATGDGEKVITATVTDTETNTTSGSIVVGAITVDTYAPSSPSQVTIAIAQGQIANSNLSGGVNAQEAASGVNFPVPLPDNVAIGDVITITIPASTGGTPQIVSYTVTAADVVNGVANVPVPGSVLVASGDGSKPITSVVSDSAGNLGPTVAVGTFVVDATPPNAPTQSNVANAAQALDQSSLSNGLNAAEVGSGVQVPVALPANIQTGDVITLTLTNTGGGTPVQVTYTAVAADVTAGVASVPVNSAQLTSAGNGTVILTASVTDAVGNQSLTPIAVGSVVIDTVAPNAPSQANITAANAALQAGELGGGGLNANEVADGAAVPVPLPANIQTGNLLSLSIPATDGGIAQQINYSVTGMDVAAGYASVPVSGAQWTASGQGIKAIRAVVTDGVGNVSASPILVATVLLDTTPPSAPSPANITAASTAFAAGELVSGLNAVEVQNGTDVPVALPSNVAVGDVVTLTLNNSAGPTSVTASYVVTGSDVTAGVATVPVSAAQLSSIGNGQVSMTAVVADSVGNVSAIPINVGTVKIDTVAPNAPSAANETAARIAFENGELGAGGLNAAEIADGVSVPVPLPANAEVGDVVTVTVPGTNGGTNQQVSYTVTAANVTAGVVNVPVAASLWSNSGTGSKQLTATVMDSVGNVSAMPIAVGTVVLDVVAPSNPLGASVSNAAALFHNVLGEGITSANVGTTGIAVPVPLPANVAVGDVVTLTVPASGAGTAQTVSHTVTTQEVMAGVGQVVVSVATLQAAGDGNKTLTASYADAVGNVGPTGVVLGTVLVSLSIPNLEANPGVLSGGINAADLINNNSVSIPVSLPQGTTAGDVIQLTIPGSNGSPSQTVSYTVTAADVAANSAQVPVPSSTIAATGNGDKVITATITDSETGTVSAPITVGAVTVDTTAPTAPSPQNVAAAQTQIAAGELVGGVNAQEAANGILIPIALPANVAVGDVVTVTIPASGAGQAQQISYLVTAADVINGVAVVPVSNTALAASGDGSKPIVATVTDTTGNVSPSITVGSFVIDVTPPNAPTPANISAASSQFNASALAGGLNAVEVANGTPVPVALPENVQVGDVVTLTLTPNNGSQPVQVTDTVTMAELTAGVASVLVSAAQLTALGNGTVVLTAKVADSVGNQSVTPIAVGSVMIDTVIPNAPSLANVNAANAAFQNSELANGLNVADLANGTIVPVPLSSNATAGDVVSLTIPATNGGVTQIVKYTVSMADVTAGLVSIPVSAAVFNSTGQGIKPLTAVVSDVVGNVSLTPIYVGSVLLDTVAPSAPSEANKAAAAAALSSSELAGGLNAAEAADGASVPVAMPANVQAGDVVTLTLSTPNGSSVSVQHTVMTADVTSGVASVSVSAAQFVSLGDGTVTATAVVMDGLGNTSATPITVGTFLVDTIVPSAPSLVNTAAANSAFQSSELSSGLNAVEVANGTVVPVALPANVSVGDIVTLTIPGSGAGAEQKVTYTVIAADVTAGVASVPVSAAQLTNSGQGSKPMTAVVKDAVGNESVMPIPVGNLLIDTVAPTAPSQADVTKASNLLSQIGGSVTQANASNGLAIPVPLSANAAVGDVVTLTIPASGSGTAQTVKSTVTAADVGAGVGQVVVSLPIWTASGDGSKSLTVAYADASGNLGPSNVVVGTLGVALGVPNLETKPGALSGGLNAADLTGGGVISIPVTLPPNTPAGHVVNLIIPGSGGNPSQTVTYTVTANDATSGTANVPVPANTITQTGDGDKVLTATITNPTTNTTSGSVPVGAVTVDTTPPNAPSVANAAAAAAAFGASPISGGVSAAEAAAGISIPVALPGNVAVGDVVTLTIPGTGGGTTQTVSYTVSAADVINGVVEVPVPAEACTASGEGSKNMTATVVDSTGNVSAQPINVGLITIDLTLPNAPSPANIAAATALLNASEWVNGINAAEAADGSSLPVALPANVVAGNVVVLTIPAGGTGVAQSISYTVTAQDATAGVASVPITLAQLQAAGNGQKVVTAIVKDSSGNQSAIPIAVVTAMVDLTVPSAPSPANIAAAQAQFNASELVGVMGAAEIANGAMVPVALPGNVTAGDVVTLTIPASGTGTLQAVGHTVTAVEAAAGVAAVSVLAAALTNSGEGSKSLTAIVTDTVGNTSATPINVGSINLDLTTPAGTPSAANIAAANNAFNNSNISNGINLAEATAGVQIPVAIPVDAMVGDVLTLSIPATSGGVAQTVTHTLTAAENISGVASVPIVLQALVASGQGSKALTAMVNLASGGQSVAINAHTIMVDTIPPNAPLDGSISAATAAFNQGEFAGGINADEAADGVMYPLALPANASAGDVVTLSLPGTGSGNTQMVSYTVTAADATAGYASIPISLAMLSASGDGTKSPTATIVDAFGNPGTTGLIGNAFVLNTVRPSAPSLQNSNAAAAVFNASELAGGLNAAEVAVGVDVPVALPANAMLGEVLRLTIPASGSGTAQTVSHTINAQNLAEGFAEITVSSATWLASGDGTKSLSAIATNLAGNASLQPIVIGTVTVDTVVPAAPAAADLQVAHAAFAANAILANGINAAEAQAGVTIPVAISANAVIGDVLQVTIPAGSGGTAQTVLHTVIANDLLNRYANVEVSNAVLTAAGNGSKTITAIEVDSVGNATVQAIPVGTVLVDLTPPDAPSGANVTVANSLFASIFGGGLYASNTAIGVSVPVPLPVNVQVGDAVTLSISATNGGAIQTISSMVTPQEVGSGIGQIAVSQAILAASGNGVKTFSAIVTDSVGNQSASAIAVGTTVLDLSAPNLNTFPGVLNGGLNANELTSGSVALTVTLPTGTATGNVIALTIPGTGAGTSQTFNYTVTAQDVGAGSANVSVPVANFTNSGNGNKLISAAVTSSGTLVGSVSVGSITIDTIAPSAPTPQSISAANAALQASNIVNGVNLAEATAGIVVPVALSGNAMVGDIVHLQIPKNNGGVQTVDYTITVADIAANYAAVSVPLAALTAAGDGLKSMTVLNEDRPGNQAASTYAATVQPILIDLTPPNAPSVANVTAANQAIANSELANGLSPNEASNGTVIPVALPANIAVGDVISMTIPAASGGTAATVSYSVTQADVTTGYASVPVSGPALVATGEGSKAITAIVTDSVGNSGTPINVATVALNIGVPLAPLGASITAAQTATNTSELGGGLNAGEASNGTFLYVALPVNADVGVVLTVTLPATSGGTAQQITHTLTALDITNNYAAVGVTASQLLNSGQGSKTPTVVASNAQGSGTAYSAPTWVLDTILPSDPTPASVTATATAWASSELGNGGINAAEAADGTVVPIPVAGNAQAGDIATLTIPASGSGTAQQIAHTLTGNEVTLGVAMVAVTAGQLTAAGPGSKALTVSYQDAVGNQSATPYTIGTVIIDAEAPNAPSGASSTAAATAFANGPLAGGLNATEAAAGVIVPVALAGNSVVGDIVTLTVPGTGGGTAQQVAHTVTVVDLAASYAMVSVSQATWLASGQGTKVLTAIQADVVGNVGAQITVGSVVLDTELPNAPSPANVAAATAAFNAGLGDGVNAVEAAAGILVATPLPANVVTGDVVTLTVSGTNGGVAQTAAYTVTALDVISGYVSVSVGSNALTLSGNGSKVVTAIVRDTLGNQSATPISVGAFVLDTVAPSAPSGASIQAATAAFSASASLSNGINASEAAAGVGVPVGIPANAEVGDVMTLLINASSGGTAQSVPYTIVAADLTAGYATIPVAQNIWTASGQGNKTLTATAMDKVGNPAANPIAVGSVLLDTVLPSAPSQANITAAATLFNNSELAGGLNRVEASDGTSVPIPLPSNAVAGDVISVTWPGATVPTNQVVTYTVTGADVAAGVASVPISSAQITAAGNGQKTVTAVVQDSVGNQSAQPISLTPFTVDLVAPDAPSAANTTAAGTAQAGTALLNGINQVEAQSSINVAVPLPSNAVVGDVVTLTLPGTNGGVAQTATHTVAAADIAAGYANVVMTPAKMAASGDGTKNISAIVTDGVGNPSATPIAVATVVLDTTPPNAPAGASTTAANTVFAGFNNVINLATVAGSGGANIPVAVPQNAVVGDVVTLTIPASSGGAAQTVQATLTNADITQGYVNVLVPTATLTASGVGSKSFTAVFTDAVGNAGSSIAVGSCTVDTVAPAAPSGANLTAAQTAFNASSLLGGLNAAEATAGVGVPVALPSNATDTDVLTLTIPGTNGGTTQAISRTITAAEVLAGYASVAVAGSVWNASGQGSKVMAAIVRDASGNVSATSISVGTVLFDSVLPSAPSPANVSAASAVFSTNIGSAIDAAEGVSGVTVPVALPSNAALGEVVTLTLPATGSGSAQTVNHTIVAADLTNGYASVSVSSAAIVASGQGNKSLTAVVTDSVGNVSATPITVGSVIIDTEVPNAPSVANNTAATAAFNASNVANGINATEAAAGVSIAVALPANGVAGDVIRLSIPNASSGSTTVSYTVIAADVTAGYASVPVSAAAITAVGNGSKSITAQVTDAVGNQGASYNVATVVVDTVAPNIASSTIGGANSIIENGEVPFTVTGTCEAGALVNLNFGSANHAATVTGTTWSYVINTADIISMGQGAETVQISATDGVGNVTTISQNITVATIIPITLSSNVDNVGNLDVMSSLVINATESISAVSGKFIRIVNDGGVGYSDETTVNSQTISVTDTSQVTISGSRIIVKPTFNLDLANNYHIEVDAGAFVGVSTGTASTAIADSTTINFSTVTPVGGSGSTPTAAVASVKMNTSSGAMESSFSWWDIRGIGSGDAGVSAGTFSLGTGSYALVFKDYDPLPIDPNTGVGLGVGNPSFQFTVTNFGFNDLIYIDNQINTTASQNDVTLIGGIHNGNAPTTLQFDGYQNLPQPDRKGPGLLNVTIEGSSLGFDDYNGMVGLLGNGAKPIISG